MGTATEFDEAAGRYVVVFEASVGGDPLKLKPEKLRLYPDDVAGGGGGGSNGDGLGGGGGGGGSSRERKSLSGVAFKVKSSRADAVSKGRQQGGWGHRNSAHPGSGTI